MFTDFVRENGLKIWKLLSLYCSCIPPSETLVDPLLNFLMTYCDETDNEEEIEFSKLCFMRVYRCYEDNLRREIPGVEEIMFI